MAEPIYPKGVYFNPPSEKAPSFVKGSIKINRQQLIDWLDTQGEEWITLDVKEHRVDKTKCSVTVNNYGK